MIQKSTRILPLFLVLAVYASGIDLAPVGPFLADREGMLAAEVLVKSVETRWMITEGGYLPILLVGCEMREKLAGQADWAPGQVKTVLQFDYSDMMWEPIAPPALEGHRYLLWANAIVDTPEDPMVGPMKKWGVDLVAHAVGFLLVRGKGEREFIYWDKTAYSVAAIRTTLGKGGATLLGEITDPGQRIRTAEKRLDAGPVSDPAGFVSILVRILTNTEAEMQNIDPDKKKDKSFFGAKDNTPFTLRDSALGVLRKMGADDRYRPEVVSGLKTAYGLVDDPNAKLQFALALAYLKDDTGCKRLLSALETGEGDICTDPESKIEYAGRFQYDESIRQAAAYGLGLLGRKEGLKHDDQLVRLAAADALVNAGSPDAVAVLKEMSVPFNGQVAALAKAGTLAEVRETGDYQERYPKEWVKIHMLLAQAGNDESLKALADALIVDYKTYPSEKSLAAMQIQSRTPLGAGWASLKDAVWFADKDAAKLLQRLGAQYKDNEAWMQEPLLSLRGSLGDQQARDHLQKAALKADRPDDKARIDKLLASEDPNKRAQGLAAIGERNVEEYYGLLIKAAGEKEGVELDATLFALSNFDKPIPDEIVTRILAFGDIQAKQALLELITRKDPARYAQELMLSTVELSEVLRKLDKNAENAYEIKNLPKYLVRTLARLARQGLPDVYLKGIEHEDEFVRLLVVTSLGMTGHPDAIAPLKKLNPQSERLKKAIAQALEHIGPME